MSFRTSRRRGSVAVEFALTFPVWIGAIAMTMEYSWYVYQQATLDMALNDGCRAASVMDPGPGDWRLSTMIARAESTTTERLADLGESCDGCVFDVHLQGSWPERQISCEVTRPARTGSTLIVSYDSLRSERVTLLEFQGS